MLTREHIPENVKRNEEATKYQNANDAIDLSGIADAPTKAALEQLLIMVKALYKTSKSVV